MAEALYDTSAEKGMEETSEISGGWKRSRSRRVEGRDGAEARVDRGGAPEDSGRSKRSADC